MIAGSRGGSVDGNARISIAGNAPISVAGNAPISIYVGVLTILFLGGRIPTFPRWAVVSFSQITSSTLSSGESRIVIWLGTSGSTIDSRLISIVSTLAIMRVVSSCGQVRPEIVPTS